MSISSTRIGSPVFMINAKVCKDKHISWWVNQETSSMLDKIASKTVYKDKDGDQ